MLDADSGLAGGAARDIDSPTGKVVAHDSGARGYTYAGSKGRCLMGIDDILANPEHWRDAAKDVIDHASLKVVAPILGEVNQQGSSIVAALKDTRDWITAERKALVEFLSGWIKVGK